ncbi:hypothetical protein SBOR_6414 [Sclerotinia borealis F-4128]|uniref:Uncharacterized protein n=1 Tax=Sclerotinia borealis (strain F-4128) TaxID=1432307 RepID=W9C8V0_SCLBF|nr:hypothetical protein SBOR_6414 [Sclerotinia borealis F-4128]
MLGDLSQNRLSPPVTPAAAVSLSVSKGPQASVLGQSNAVSKNISAYFVSTSIKPSDGRALTWFKLAKEVARDVVALHAPKNTDDCWFVRVAAGESSGYRYYTICTLGLAHCLLGSKSHTYAAGVEPIEIEMSPGSA